MWPWSHLAVGYLIASLWRRLRSRRPPSEGEALAIAFGTQFPDLVDKPLGWGTTLIPAGRSMAHSLTMAVPLSVAVYLLARRYDRRDVGVAFALGYLSHLPGDMVLPVVFGGDVPWRFLIWPFVTIEPSSHEAMVGHALELLLEFLVILQTPRGIAFLVAQVVLLGATVALWWRDGWPGLGAVRA